ncbi:HlyD family secretion protein [Intestinirhabdus alba]|uniref:HlyD family efflux transporter periplasmic adaptor subunit n=1 Tax=Intestinirhabdus alba TaxID=2899544 RepID=A0A6L6IGH3_9ENTR|nr:HlyD family secretion protein [Intestinirhabdus alba]MTH44746.1 HlyD family efflux transporter periplasmic adaptor subunit [Intestinirhabdus alba]
MDTRDLFRREAIDNLRTRWLGQALLIGSYPLWVAILVTVLLLAALMSVIIFGEYTRRISVYGEVTTLPRAINIYSPGQGFISRSWKHPGEQVKKGDYLYQIDVSRITRSGNVSENILQAGREQLRLIEEIIHKLEENKAVTLSQMKQQLQQYEQAYQETKATVTTANEGMLAMKATMNNYAEYKRRGLINIDQMSNQRYLYYQQQSVYQNLNAQLIQQGLQITSLRGEMFTRATDFDNEISRRKYELSDLRRQLAEMDASGALLVSSPVDGKVETLSVTQGQMVNSGDSLAQVIPAESEGYFLILWLPNSATPYVKPGDPINISFDAFPYEKFGHFPGEIKSISSVPVSPQELNSYSNSPQGKQTGIAEPFYKVIVDISRDKRLAAMILTTGMKARAMVFLEKRPIYQWMIAPFYDFYRSLMGPVNE